MSSKKRTVKRVFKSYIFRILICATVLFATVFFPFVFAYPNAERETKNLIIVFVVFVCVVEVLAFILISHYLIYGKIAYAAKHLSKMAKDGVAENVSEKSIDNSISEILSAINDTVGEYARLEQVHRSFVANASHELRSPLTSVQGFLQAVLDGAATPADSEKYLKIALSETKRLNALITSMLDLSRLDSGKNPLVYSKFDIADVINEVATKFEPALIKKALQINVEASSSVCYVYADKDKIIQVVTNLVDNAIKYSPAYSRIILTTSIHQNKVYVTVKDFGYGISKKDQMLIWDTFYMTDKSRSPVKTKGTGLGLSIVKKIIEEHGEVIWVESSRGAGATFIFTLTLFDPVKHRVAKGKIIQPTEDENNADNTSAKTEKNNGTVL